MAYPTQAEWRDYMAELTVYPTLGQVYLDESPIFVAMGLPVPGSISDLRINWTDGASADYVSATDFTSAGTHSKVDDSRTSSFALLTAPAQTNIKIEYDAKPDLALELSMAGASSAIYDKFVHGLINGTNTGNQLSGLDTFITAAAATPVSTDTQRTCVEADLLEGLDELRAELPSENNFILCGKAGYTKLKKLLRASGGTTPIHVGMANLGFQILTYDNMPILHTRYIEVSGCDHTFYMVNIGPNGVTLIVPEGKNMWSARGPKEVPGVLATTWDIVLGCQLVYITPRAAGTLTMSETTGACS